MCGLSAIATALVGHAVDLVPALDNSSGITVFAPTNRAFNTGPDLASLNDTVATTVILK
jgi:uncharacterized surface protein with fasciclin (FAS1) repeats